MDLDFNETLEEKAKRELHKDAAFCFESIVRASHSSHLHPISQTIQKTWVRHAGYCWWSKNELISDILLWTLINQCWPTSKDYIHQLGADSRCRPRAWPIETDGERRRERNRDSKELVLSAGHYDDALSEGYFFTPIVCLTLFRGVITKGLDVTSK